MSNKPTLGLKENWIQFTILVIVNAFVGGMVGLERTIFPKFAELEFGVASKTAMLSFIIAFGITKAITNYFTGKLDRTYRLQYVNIPILLKMRTNEIGYMTYFGAIGFIRIACINLKFGHFAILQYFFIFILSATSLLRIMGGVSRGRSVTVGNSARWKVRCDM